MPETENTAIAALSENVVKARFEDLDRETIETIKSRVTDVIGCIIGGAHAPGNDALVKLVKKWGGEAEAAILVHGGKVPAHNAAMINSVMARSYDFEEQSCNHQGATTIPTALTMGELKGVSGKEFLIALILGTDIGNRMSSALDFDFFQGPDGVGSLQPFCAAAIAARLLNLTPLEVRNAFGIVLHQTAGSIQSYWDGDMTFKLNNGFAARSGIFAAELAEAGLTGAIDALQSRFGYYQLNSHGCAHPEKLTQDIGKKYNIGRNIFKQFPGGGPNHLPIECALELANQHNIKAKDIAEVTIGLARFFLDIYYAQPWHIRDFPPGDAMFSYRYTVACALQRRHFNQEDIQEQAIRDPEINALISKVNLVELPNQKRGATELRVKMKDGQEFVKFTEGPRHGLQGKDEINAKFMNQVEFSKTVSLKNAENIIKLLDNLEEVDDINRITKLMVS